VTDHELTVEAGRTGARYWRDLWQYRGLFYFLTWRDILVRYKQTLLGAGWALLRPVLTMVVFSVVFGGLASLPSGGVPYPILVYAALLPWQLFAGGLTECGTSVQKNSNLVSKIYFPRLIVPLSAVMVSLVDFLVASGVLAVMMVWYGVMPGLRVLLLPLFVLLALLCALGAGLWLAALNVKYRDVQMLIPFLVQVGLFASPVGYSSDIVPERWRFLYSLNPMVGVIDGFRWALGTAAGPPYWPSMAIAAALALLLFAFGVWYFRRTERTFADVI